MLVKICGLRRIIDIDYVNELKPDFIGFVFALNKTRTIDINTAKLLKERLNNDIKAVGVFRNNDINYVKEVIDSNVIDMIQLHGNEDDERFDRRCLQHWKRSGSLPASVPGQAQQSPQRRGLPAGN